MSMLLLLLLLLFYVVVAVAAAAVVVALVLLLLLLVLLLMLLLLLLLLLLLFMLLLLLLLLLLVLLLLLWYPFMNHCSNKNMRDIREQEEDMQGHGRKALFWSIRKWRHVVLLSNIYKFRTMIPYHNSCLCRRYETCYSVAGAVANQALQIHQPVSPVPAVVCTAIVCTVVVCAAVVCAAVVCAAVVCAAVVCAAVVCDAVVCAAVVCPAFGRVASTKVIACAGVEDKWKGGGGRTQTVTAKWYNK